MLETKVTTLALAISLFCACSSQDALEIDQSEPNYHGDETDNAELEDLTKDTSSEESVDLETDSELGDFKTIFSSEFSKCAKQVKFFDFSSGDCTETKSMQSCSYADIISGDYSEEIDKDSFEELFSDESLIQCFDHNGKKMVQVAEVRNDGSGNLDIEISCWIDAEEPCNL